MKILVFSDSHGDTEKIDEIIHAESLCTELVIHLGDKATDISYIRDRYPQIAFISVRGNCDFFGIPHEAPSDYCVTLEKRRIYMTHGHLKGVKSGDLSGLEYEAHKNNCDIVLYGHTHVARLDNKDGVYYFNPGSISRPRDATAGTYGVITLDKAGAEFKIIKP